MDPDLLKILKKNNIIIENENIINGMIISRDTLLSKEKFVELKDDIETIKKKFSSSRLTALQTTAEKNQKWPLLNLIRQLLKASNIKMTPKRVCDGYDKNGKKKFKRYFILEKLNSVKKDIVEENKTEQMS